MQNPKATLSLSDALAEVTAKPDESTPVSLEEAFHAVVGTEKPDQSSYGALVMQAGKQALPKAAELAAEFGTNPNIAKTLSTIARGGTTAAGVLGGAATGNVAQVLAASKEGWAAGKGAYFLGKGMQSVARPVSTMLEKAGPLAAIASGAQSVLDLAQMVDPKRKDIGVLGVGATQAPLTDAEAKQLNADNQKRAELVALAQGRKLTMPEAVATLLPIETVQHLINLLKKK